MFIMNTNRQIYHWKDKKNPLEKYLPKGEESPHGAKISKDSIFTKNAVLMHLDSGRKIRRI